MGIGKFKRGLDDDFVKHLNQLYAAGGWWRQFVDDKDLFFAIRDNSVNFYYRGCSLAKLRWNRRAKTATGEIHYKYLLKPSVEPPTIKFRNTGLEFPKDVRGLFLDDLDDVNALKLAVKRYADSEKHGVHDVLLNKKNWGVLDLEITLNHEGLRYRLDLAMLRRDRQQNKPDSVVFFEAKHFRNKELRTQRNEAPVVHQMRKYSDLLTLYRSSLVGSYLRVCENLRDLQGMAGRHPERHQLTEAIAGSSKGLVIDSRPRLIVFGFDRDQRDGKAWGRHFASLKKALGRDDSDREFLLAAGNPRNIVLDQY